MIEPERVDRVAVWAAGSLAEPLGHAKTDLAAQNVELILRCSPSGTLRYEIETGGRPDIFLSAAREHVDRLVELGLARDSRRLCGNRIVALIGPSVDANAPLLDLLLSETTRLATSTPAADPSGDYAYRLFERADEIRPGVAKTLRCKAQHLAGSPSVTRAPAGQHHYAWMVGEGMADIFLTYVSNAVQAVRRRPELRIVEPPPELAVEADFYGVRMDRRSNVGEIVWRYVFGDRFSGHLREAGFALGPWGSEPGPRCC